MNRLEKLKLTLAKEVANQLACPALRSMYPMTSRGQMCDLFEDLYKTGWEKSSAEYEKIIAELEVALKLYADRKNWRYCANQDIGAHDAWLDFKPDHFCKVYNELGGYNARQALKKLNEFRGWE